jgi:hypothetical protein
VVDALGAVGVIGGLLGTAGGVVTTIHTVRTSSVRRHVERARDASALLENLRLLPEDKSEGSRLLVDKSDSKLHHELSRIVRENASMYALQNPTPTGLDFARLLMPAYGFLFSVFAVIAAVEGNVSAAAEDKAAHTIALGLFSALALLCFAITAGLQVTLARRNLARELAGTPGRERYFGPVHELLELIRGLRQRRKLGLHLRRMRADEQPSSHRWSSS